MLRCALGSCRRVDGVGLTIARKVTDSRRWAHSGSRGLQENEPLIFEKDGGSETSAVDVPSLASDSWRIPVGLRRSAPVGLPGLHETEILRHYVRLSQKNYSIDTGIYPLGSCTMKYNPRQNEAVVALSGFSDVHPLQDSASTQGVLEALHLLQEWLLKLTGMDSITLTPAAGSHGELTGMFAIKRALQSTGQAHRDVCLIPESAHGTNPATAVTAGFKVRSLRVDCNGKVDFDDLVRKLTPDVGALMLTNPNTCGIFESSFLDIARLVKENGAYFYMDGANMNSFIGRLRVGDAGVDAMHINLHKTFSTPHGGGGPGGGPVVFSKRLAPYAPLPRIEKTADGKFSLLENDPSGKSLGRIKAFHGQTGVNLRALAYMIGLGGSGLRESTTQAVLNANYVRARLADVMTLAYPNAPSMHEVLFDDRFLAGTGVTTLDLAKCILDYGAHPWTMYFPLVVHGAILIEPTESESRQTLDRFVTSMRKLVEDAKSGKKEVIERMTTAPHNTPIGRANEVLAATLPILRWSSDMKEKEEEQKKAHKKSVK